MKINTTNQFLVEVLANELHLANAAIGDEPTAPGCIQVGKDQPYSQYHTEKSMVDWRNHPELRKNYRELAKVMLSRLQDSGIKITPARPQQVERAAKELSVIPASIAYVLETENEEAAAQP